MAWFKQKVHSIRLEDDSEAINKATEKAKERIPGFFFKIRPMYGESGRTESPGNMLKVLSAIERQFSFEFWMENGIISYYVWAADRMDAQRIKSQLTTHYPNAEIEDLENHRLLPESSGSDQICCGKAVMQCKHYYPFQTKFDVDPMAALLNVLSYSKPSSTVIVQVLMKPASPDWCNKAYDQIWKLTNEHCEGWIDPHVVKPTESGRVQAALFREKAGRTAFQTEINIMVTSGDPVYAAAKVREVSSVFRQFNHHQGNKFGYRVISTRKLPAFYVKMVYRLMSRTPWFFGRDMYALTTDELANIVHLPGNDVTINGTTINAIANSSIYISGANIKITNCTISTATNSSIRLVNGSSPRIENSTVLGYDYTFWIGNGSEPFLYKLDYDRSKVICEDTTDSDNDTLPDAYEIYRYALNPNNASDRWADTDGDGYSNYNETMLMDTDPTNESDPVTDIETCWGNLSNPVNNITIEDNATQPVITVDNNNTIHMVYLYTYDNGTSAIRYQKSANGGANWTEPADVAQAEEPENLAIAYDSNADRLSITWQESNIYDANKPESFVKYMTAPTVSDESNPFSYPVFIEKNSFVEDYPAIESISSYTSHKYILYENETYGQSFTSNESFNHAGVYSVNDDNGIITVSLYQNSTRALISSERFVEPASPSWLDLEFELQAAGSYYFEWNTTDLDADFGARYLDNNPYWGGVSFHNGTEQSYDFKVRYWADTYSVRSDINITSSGLSLNYTDDSATNVPSGTDIARIISIENETYGQTFTAAKCFDKVGLYASSDGNNVGTLYVALYNDSAKTQFIGYHQFVNFTDNSWLEFTVPVQIFGTYYLEWTTDNASRGVGAYSLNYSTYSGGCAYNNGTAQTYDFLMRYYTITYDAYGYVLYNTETIENDISQATVSWDATTPINTEVYIYVSNDGGSNWVTASNHQIVYFNSPGNEIKYEVYLASEGVSTAVFRSLKIDQSTLDYGINPSIAGGNDNIYVAYQPTTLPEGSWENITVAKTTDSGVTWSNTVFSGETSSNEDDITQITCEGDNVYLIYAKSNTLEEGYWLIRGTKSNDNGANWDNPGTIRLTDAIGLTGPESLSIAAKDGTVISAYSCQATEESDYEIYTHYGQDQGASGLNWATEVQHTNAQAVNPKISLDSLKNVYITWSQTDNSSYLKVVDMTGEDDLLTSTPIRLGGVGVDNTVVVNDLSDEIHLGWKETVNGRSVIKYWTNSPTTAASVGGTVNNYISMLPTSAFKDNAELRRVGLESRMQLTTQKLYEEKTIQTINDMTYRVDPKITFSDKQWLTEITNQNIISRKTQQVIKEANEISQVNRLTQYAQSLSKDWNLIVFDNLYSITYNDRTNGGYDFSLTVNNPDVNRPALAKWKNVQIMGLSINRYSMISYDIWTGNTANSQKVKITLEFRIASYYKELSTRGWASNQQTKNIFQILGITQENPDYYKNLLIEVRLALCADNPSGTSTYTGTLLKLNIESSSLKDDVAANANIGGNIATWNPKADAPYGTNVDGDFGIFKSKGITERHVAWTLSSVSYRTYVIADDATYLYFKAVTSLTGLSTLEVSQGYGAFILLWYNLRLSDGSWVSSGAPYKININRGVWKIYVSESTPLSDLYTILHQKSPNGNAYRITSVELKMTVPSRFTAEQWVQLDYLYISRDLDNDGITDEAGKEGGYWTSGGDIDGDGMSNWYEWNYGRFYRIHDDSSDDNIMPYVGIETFITDEGSCEVKGGWQDPYEYNARYAVLVSGQPQWGYQELGQENPYDAFVFDLNEFYDTITGTYGYSVSKTYCLWWNGIDPEGRIHGLDGDASWNDNDSPNGWGGIYNSINEINKVITKNDFLLFFIISHAADAHSTSEAIIKLYSGTNAPQAVSDRLISDIAERFDETIGNRYARSLFILASCWMGGSIASLSGEGRIIITATSSTENSRTWWTYGTPLGETQWDDHMEFLYNDKNGNQKGLIRQLKEGYPSSLYDAYLRGYDAGLDCDFLESPLTDSTAYIDDDGDGIGHYVNDIQTDGKLAQKTFL